MTIALPDSLLAELRGIAEAEGKSVDELTVEALRRFVAAQALEQFRVRAEARRRGMTDAQVEDAVERAVQDVRER